MAGGVEHVVDSTRAASRLDRVVPKISRLVTQGSDRWFAKKRESAPACVSPLSAKPRRGSDHTALCQSTAVIILKDLSDSRRPSLALNRRPVAETTNTPT